MQRIMRNSVNGHSFYISKPSESTSSLRVFVEGLCPTELFGYLMSSFLILCSLETSAIFRSRLISVVGILRNQAVLNRPMQLFRLYCAHSHKIMNIDVNNLHHIILLLHICGSA